MKKNNRNLSKKEIELISESVVGKKFGELGSLVNDNKGGFGLFMEEVVFEYDINSDSNPDFKEAGIEMKVTPYRKNANGTYSAKERLVLNIINYMEEYKNTFYTSSFWNKNKTLQIFFYLWEPFINKADFKITHQILFEYPEEDLIVIQNDWELIINKIKEGLAHEISEADTLYLGACPKGANKTSLRKQPFSNIMAMQRAYCLKQSYMTQLIRSRVIGKKGEQILSISEIKEKKFEDAIYEKLKRYIGLSRKKLIDLFSLENKSNKSINEILLARMLGIKGRVSTTEEFMKANIIAKTIRVEENGKVIESMSFPAFKYNEIVNEEWEASSLRYMFETTKFMFVIFKKKDDEYYFEKIKFWNMPISDLDNYVRLVWEKTVSIIKNGNIVKYIDKNGKRITNFPGMAKNQVSHVRPHAQNKSDVYELPIKDKVTESTTYSKHCFWLNNTYVMKIIK